MKKKEKPRVTTTGKIHYWFIRNSILYRTMRKIIKARAGQIILVILSLFLLLVIIFPIANKYIVKKTVRELERAIKEGDKSIITRYVDTSRENPYRLTLPDFPSLVEEKVFFQFNIHKIKLSRSFLWAEVEVKVNTFRGGVLTEHFQGRILLKKFNQALSSWKIVGMEVL